MRTTKPPQPIETSASRSRINSHSDTLNSDRGLKDSDA